MGYSACHHVDGLRYCTGGEGESDAWMRELGPTEPALLNFWRMPDFFFLELNFIDLA